MYYYRLPTAADRLELSKRLAAEAAAFARRGGGQCGLTAAAFVGALEAEQRLYLDHMHLEPGIARNDALRENVFVVVTCVFNRMPVFVVGKPGTSKTLTLQIVASNLLGRRSADAFWRAHPAVYIFPYQCSPLSTSGAIETQFAKACAYQAQQPPGEVVTVLLLDEVGLAEHSPDMPLKVLHEVLVDPPVAIVGLSNWALDPAKMNRAVLLRRPDPARKARRERNVPSPSRTFPL